MGLSLRRATLLLFLFTGMLFGSDAPMAYVLTIALVEMIVSAGEFSGMDLASKIVGQLAVGGCWAI